MTNISRSKSKEEMKFDQLIEYYLRNIFLEKSCTQYGGETNPRPFLKKVLYIFCFYYLPSRGLSKLIETKLQTTCIYLKSFIKNKNRSDTCLPASFSAWFLKEDISLVIFFRAFKMKQKAFSSALKHFHFICFRWSK